MKVWITGIAGFLGSHLADALIAEGHEVYGNDNGLCGDWGNVPSGVKLSWHYGCDFGNLYDGMNFIKPDVVVHCAATAHEGLSSFSPSFITKNIYESSVATFSAAIACGVKRIVYMSSMSRYGDGVFNLIPTGDYAGADRLYKAQKLGPPFKENFIPNPVDPYGIAKVAAEDTLRVLCSTHSVNYSILAPHNIIGIRQKYNDPARNVASIMINRCLRGEPIIIYGDGEQKRCFSPVKDCIPSIVKAIEGAADGEIVNIGPDGGEISINKLARIIMELTEFNGDIVYVPARPNEVKDAYCSSEKSRRLLGYKENESVRDCLTEMVKEIRERGTKEFDYFFPIEIENNCPETWLKRLI